MKVVDGLNYRQWQKRNSTRFKQLSKKQQKQVRSLGYRNVGWQKVQASWDILESYTQSISNPPNLFDRKLQKGDVLGALDYSILEAENAQEIAEEAIASIEDQHQKVTDITRKALEKYQLL
ncbi:MAG: hypothetical protein F6K30_04145 [Cyanothece sp. SIO2G6]|nr:hypothetical protein [Cyanothece sp. SIO2G6]